jgi:aconitate hydratase
MKRQGKDSDPFGARATLETSEGPVNFYRIEKLEEEGLGDVSRLPISIKVLLESLIRHCDGSEISRDDVVGLAGWDAGNVAGREFPFKPARVVMQDFTGVPAVVDLAALRSAMVRFKGDPRRINPKIPVDLVIDHSVQVDHFGTLSALDLNAKREFERNRERYEFLRWGAEAFDNLRVVPPATGIDHQVNLEYLASVVHSRMDGGIGLAYPDTLVGTDSHTTMINGLGVVGWGVGGIEAEAVMLGQPLYMLTPEVVGFMLTGELPAGVTATDLVLTITEMLRSHGVVGKFVEYYGPGVSKLALPDRATIANMSPEYGATMGFFPVDDETLRYLAASGRPKGLVDLVERYTKAQGMFRTDEMSVPAFTEHLKLDMGTVEPSMAGPKRPQDRVPLRRMKERFDRALTSPAGKSGIGLPVDLRDRSATVREHGISYELKHGSVVIAAITSCTNTSNPSVMIGAALLARNAVRRGLSVRPWVKTSCAPGSTVVARYLESSGLIPYLEALRFHIVGFGCTTCIGNSGPLPPHVARAVRENDLIVAAVLSGNRNFEGRISPYVQANYLASPPLVVAYALAGTVDIDLSTEPLGFDPSGDPVFLKDIWPTSDEVREEVRNALRPEVFREQYADVFKGNETWNAIQVGGKDLYDWDQSSTYIQEPPFFIDMTTELPPIEPVRGASVLALLGDSVTTDHISPAGVIAEDGPAGRYLISRGIVPVDFNTFGSRRGNHEVMMRGTFGNVRLRNRLVPGVEGGYTIYHPTGETMDIYEAATRYRSDGTPLIVIAGKEYGTGSSRDWAAKGTLLLGIRAVLAEGYERIHRSNLIGMGILPLQFKTGENAETLGLTGREKYDIDNIGGGLRPMQEVTVRVVEDGGGTKEFRVIARVDSPVEAEYYRNGGILQTVLRGMVTSQVG